MLARRFHCFVVIICICIFSMSSVAMSWKSWHRGDGFDWRFGVDGEGDNYFQINYTADLWRAHTKLKNRKLKRSFTSLIVTYKWKPSSDGKVEVFKSFNTFRVKKYKGLEGIFLPVNDISLKGLQKRAVRFGVLDEMGKWVRVVSAFDEFKSFMDMKEAWSDVCNISGLYGCDSQEKAEYHVLKALVMLSYWDILSGGLIGEGNGDKWYEEENLKKAYIDFERRLPGWSEDGAVEKLWSILTFIVNKSNENRFKAVMNHIVPLSDVKDIDGKRPDSFIRNLLLKVKKCNPLLYNAVDNKVDFYYFPPIDGVDFGEGVLSIPGFFSLSRAPILFGERFFDENEVVKLAANGKDVDSLAGLFKIPRKEIYFLHELGHHFAFMNSSEKERIKEALFEQSVRRNMVDILQTVFKDNGDKRWPVLVRKKYFKILKTVMRKVDYYELGLLSCWEWELHNDKSVATSYRLEIQAHAFAIDQILPCYLIGE